ncbi:MAG TPA: DUF433 domain-containing protein [Polyangia bacterium]|nr:DUF433 domain-containing protein [Polyangia bacterium]
MTLPIVSEPVPLITDADGVVRVGGTRVTLDTVVEAFQEGATAEEIVQQYASLELADVYATISYYLRHQTEVEAYLRGRRAEAEVLREQIGRQTGQAGLRQRLLARRRIS